MSVVMRPRAEPSGLPLVTLAAGAGVARAVAASTRLPVELKWPNDIVIGRPWRKLGGVLCEAVGAGARVDAVVVGIGVNIQQAALPAELKSVATSIEAELGKRAERDTLLVEVLAELRTAFEWLHEGRHEEIRRAWREFGAAGLAGAFVRWNDGAGERRARARDIDHDGALVVEGAGGIERVIAGDVRWEPFAYDT